MPGKFPTLHLKLDGGHLPKSQRASSPMRQTVAEEGDRRSAAAVPAQGADYNVKPDRAADAAQAATLPGPLAILCRHCRAFRAPIQPLAVGIHRDIMDRRIPGLSNGELRGFLESYVQSPHYLRSFQPGAFRVDADGRPVAMLTDAEIAQAAELLERYSRRAAPDGAPALHREIT